MMTWFGPHHGAPFELSDLEQEPIPVGQPCTRCGEPIEPTDFGFVLDGVDLAHSWTRLPFHNECFARTVAGSVAHLQRQCSCFVKGATCTDPPELSKREAAIAAFRILRGE